MRIQNAPGAIDISVSGLRAQNKQLEIISSNIANARTTDAGRGEPYRRLEAVLKAQNDEISGVEIGKITADTSAFEKVLDPAVQRQTKTVTLVCQMSACPSK